MLHLYEKFSTFLRIEALSNNLRDFRLHKSLDNLETVRQTLTNVIDRFANFQAQAMDVHIDFPLLQRLALPIASGIHQGPSIKIQDTRILLMEVLLHRGTQIGGWRSRQIHEAILTTFGLHNDRYTLTQLRYDLRKMKSHALLDRADHRYAYQLTYKASASSSCSSSSTNESVDPSPTAYSTGNQHNTNRPAASSRPPITKLMLPFSASSTYLPREGSESEILTPKSQESMKASRFPRATS